MRQGLNEDIRDPKNLSDLLTHFFAYREPDHEEWDSAVAEFKERIPELADRAQHLIEAEKKGNRAFRDSFDAFYTLCRQAINPNLSEAAVEKMLIQHLLTERIFRRVFKAEEFRSRNVIASEIEKVIQSMTSRALQPRPVPQRTRPLLQGHRTRRRRQGRLQRKASIPQHRL